MVAATTWTPARLRVFSDMARERHSAAEIAARLGVTADSVRQLGSALGVAVGRMGRPPVIDLVAPAPADSPEMRAMASALSRRAVHRAATGDRDGALDLIQRGLMRLPFGEPGSPSSVVATFAHLSDLLSAPESHGPDGALVTFGSVS